MLTGSAYFDFEEDSYRFHSLVERAIEEEVAVTLTWRALVDAVELEGESLSARSRLLAAHEVIRDRKRQRRFRQAVFAMMYRHDDDPEDPVTLRAGVKMAGMDWGVVEDAITRIGKKMLDDVRMTADDSGVVELPAIVTGGPAVAIQLTPAAAGGPALAKLEIIERMAAEDGIWALRKP